MTRARGRLGQLGSLVFLAVFLETPAWAHEESGLGGFVAGLSHPFTGIDHLLAMVSVGIWGAILGRPLVVALPVVFPALMAVGGLLGIAAIPFPPVELGIALSVIVLGGAIAAEWRAPIPVAIALVAMFALFHGYAHGRELPRAADPIFYSIGFMLATGSLHVAGIVIGLLHRRTSPLLIRGIGAMIGAAGLVFLVKAFS